VATQEMVRKQDWFEPSMVVWTSADGRVQVCCDGGHNRCPEEFQVSCVAIY